MPDAPPPLPAPPIVDMAKATPAPIAKRLAAGAIDALLRALLLMPLLSYAGILEKMQKQELDFTAAQITYRLMAAAL